MAGVEVHANILQSLFTQERLSYASFWFNAFLIILFSFILTGAVLYFDIAKSGFVALALLLLFAVLGIFLFSSGTILNPIYVPFVILFTYIGNTVVYYVTERKEKKAVQEAFGKYVSPMVLVEILKDPSKVK